MAQAFKDLAGKKFGRLSVIRLSENSKPRKTYWYCLCDCGKHAHVRTDNLSSGKALSCGCYAIEQRRKSVMKGYQQAAITIVYNKYKNNARLRGYSFELGVDEFVNLCIQNCNYCGNPPSKITNPVSGSGDFIWNGIDRVDNSKGYVLDNCTTCCEKCNIGKADQTLDQFDSWILDIVAHRFNFNLREVVSNTEI